MGHLVLVVLTVNELHVRLSTICFQHTHMHKQTFNVDACVTDSCKRVRGATKNGRGEAQAVKMDRLQQLQQHLVSAFLQCQAPRCWA